MDTKRWQKELAADKEIGMYQDHGRELEFYERDPDDEFTVESLAEAEERLNRWEDAA